MQRDGIDVELVAEHQALAFQRSAALASALNPAGRYLELRDLAARIERAMCQHVGALFVRPMIGNEYGVRADGFDDQRPAA